MLPQRLAPSPCASHLPPDALTVLSTCSRHDRPSAFGTPPSIRKWLIKYALNLTPPSSTHSKPGIESFEQGRVAERLKQALHGALLKQTWTDAFTSVSGDV
jgi:hypothetical protein